jgi:hypothetical protein
VTFIVDGPIGLAIACAVVLVSWALPLGIIALMGRPWELKGLSWVDRLRIAKAVNDYDSWLGLRGVGGVRRRALRSELRGNLWDAAREVGARRALSAVGPMRVLARNACPMSLGPRWLRGLLTALLAATVVVALQMLVLFIWVDGAAASGATHAEGGVTFFPGMWIDWATTAPDSVARLSLEFGPVAPLAAGVAFVLTARPWRLFLPFTAPRTEELQQ